MSDAPDPPYRPGLGPGPGPGLGLGLDAGGTATRWALATRDGRRLAEGVAPGLSALQLADAAGRAALDAALQAVAAALPVAPAAVLAGVTGFGDADADALAARIAAACGLPPAAVRCMTDIELACRAAFAPGRGIVLVAGTGSVAAHLDAAGMLQRAGGRGALIDDAGGGHWIATRALRAVWRAEDERPGAWRDSLLARALFEQVGGSDWAATRRAVYAASRGEVGALAAAVGVAARAGDAQALALLQRAGTELARPVAALRARVGAQPVALLGRVFDLHAAVEAALRETLNAGARPAGEIRRATLAPQHTAAVLAAGGSPGVPT